MRNPAPEGHGRVFVYDSDEGVIREITPASLFSNSNRSIPNARLSRNGAYVVFKDASSGRVHAIDFSGQNFRLLLSSGCLGNTWEDPTTKAQFVMVTKTTGVTGTVLLNIATPTERRQLSNLELCDEDVGGIDGIGISVDGQRVGGFLCGSASGLAPTPSGSAVCAASGCGGCNFSMRPTTGGTYEYGHFPDGHETICVHNANGSKKQLIDNASTVVSWARANFPISGGEPVVLNWTNDPDYVSYQWSGWRVNPILFRLSDKKWVGIKDDLTAIDVNRFSVVFLPTSTSIRSGRASANTRSSAERLFTIDGRRLGQARTKTSGSSTGMVQIKVSEEGLTKRAVWSR